MKKNLLLELFFPNYDSYRRGKYFTMLIMLFLISCSYNFPKYYQNINKNDELIKFSEEIGTSIDREERNKYGLFGDIGNFQEAQFFSIANGGFTVEVSTDIDKLYLTNFDPMAQAIMQDYLINYEEIRRNMIGFKNKWKIVAYDDHGIPITRYEIAQLGKPVSPYIGGACCGLGAGGIGLLIGSCLIPSYNPGGPGDPPPQEFFDGCMYVAIGCILPVPIGYILGNEIFNEEALQNAINTIKRNRQCRRINTQIPEDNR